MDVLKNMLLDANGNPIETGDPNMRMSLSEEEMMSNVGSFTAAAPTESSTQEGPVEHSVELTQEDSFLLFRASGEYVMHLGPTNHEKLNHGGFLVTFCTWAMNRQDLIEEFQGFLQKLGSDSEVMDAAVEKASNEAADAEKS